MVEMDGDESSSPSEFSRAAPKSGKRKKPKRRRASLKIQKVKNSETKNIPKNYGKQIIKFIQTHKDMA